MRAGIENNLLVIIIGFPCVVGDTLSGKAGATCARHTVLRWLGGLIHSPPMPHPTARMPRTFKGPTLLKEGNISLCPVDIVFAVGSQLPLTQFNIVFNDLFQAINLQY